MNPYDSYALAARNAWGIVAQGLSEADAAELAQALTAGGVACVVRPASRWSE